jgi:hypothetical protein
LGKPACLWSWPASSVCLLQLSRSCRACMSSSVLQFTWSDFQNGFLRKFMVKVWLSFFFQNLGLYVTWQPWIHMFF